MISLHCSEDDQRSLCVVPPSPDDESGALLAFEMVVGDKCVGSVSLRLEEVIALSAYIAAHQNRVAIAAFQAHNQLGGEDDE